MVSKVINTQDQHLDYWYSGDKNKKWRTDPNEITSMSIGGCQRQPFTARIEWIRIAQMIMDRYPDLTVFMSGGLDSEIALRSFRAAGLRPKLATVRFPDGKNDYDIGPMLAMVKDEFGMECDVIDFDPERFCLSGEYLEVAERYQAYSFYQQMLLKVAEDYAAPMITVDEIEIDKIPVTNWDTGRTDWRWVFLKKEDQDGVWRRFNEVTGIPALNNFYSYTPESMLAFLRLPTVAQLIRDQIPYKWSWTSSKMRIYGEAGYRFRARPKYHGMENYRHIWDYVQDNLPASLESYQPRVYYVDALTLEKNLENMETTICHTA